MAMIHNPCMLVKLYVGPVTPWMWDMLQKLELNVELQIPGTWSVHSPQTENKCKEQLISLKKCLLPIKHILC